MRKENVEADVIIYGKIVTLDVDCMFAKALVVKDGIIKYFGAREVADIMKSEKTIVYDYGNNVVYPGFMDPHTHGLMAGQRLAFQCDLVPYDKEKSMEKYVEVMAEYVKSNPNRPYYYGAGWNYFSEPTASMLDKICPDKPMILKSSDGHSLWINTACLKECGVDKDFVKQYGEAQVHVDKDGNPSGLICEMALFYVDNKYVPSKEQIKEGLLAWQEFCFSQGITAVGEALADMYEEGANAYSELVKEGKWKLRTYAYFMNKKYTDGDISKIGEVLKEYSKKYDSEYFKVQGQKIVLDGVIEAHTGALIEEYSDEKGYYGVLNIKDPEVLYSIIREVNDAGYPVHTHAIGDRASQMILDAYVKASKDVCDFDLRNLICHLQIIQDEDIKRMADYNIIAVVAPTWVPVTHPDFDFTLQYLGEKRAWNEYPIKSFEKAGATICFHTDYPINPNMNIPLSVYTATTRGLSYDDNPDMIDPSTIKNPQEAITSFKSLLAMTSSVAYAFKEENRLGTLGIGKIANLTVFDKDFIMCPTKDIMKAKVVATLVDGKEVYRANNL